MSKKDYYETLNVSKDADQSEIKKAFRRLAMKHHPDRNEGNKASEAEFKAAKEAYETLSNDQMRARYDQFGHAGVDGSGMGGGTGPDFGADLGEVFGDIFGDIFGGGGRGNTQRAQRGTDLVYTLEITLDEAMHGAEKRINIQTLVNCNTCAGSGCEPGSTPSPCQRCRGSGNIHLQQGFLTLQQTCPNCHGRGSSIDRPCKPCQGAGRTEQISTLSIKVPVGIDQGDKMRLTGKGEAGLNQGPAGDLFIQMRIKPHPVFKRESQNLLCAVPISFITATLGGEIQVPTLSGTVKLKIPAETQSNSVFRLGGKGFPKTRKMIVGDLLCRVHIETPVKLNAKQKQHLRIFESMLSDDRVTHSPKAQRWLNHMTAFFMKK